MHVFHFSLGLVGLAISYALSVTNLLSGVVNSFTETEKQMVSVERAQQYIDNVPSEHADGMLMVSLDTEPLLIIANPIFVEKQHFLWCKVELSTEF